MSKTAFNGFLLQQFGDASVLPLPRSSAMMSKLRARVLHESRELQELRQGARMSFSARHLESLLRLTCQHFASTIVSPFSFIQASRSANPVSKELVFHLSNFVKTVPSQLTAVLSAPVIASALCLDAYPPGSHSSYYRTCNKSSLLISSEFSPDVVFKKLYLQSVKDALQDASVESQACVKLEAMIESKFCQTALASFSTYSAISDVHGHTLLSFQSSWNTLRSNVTCFSCIARHPRNVLLCGHGFCDECLMIFTAPETGNTWAFCISKCPLCQTINKTQHRIKPHTAGVRALTIDGGGLETLEALVSMEYSLDLPLSTREMFDIVNASDFGMYIPVFAPAKSNLYGLGGLLALEMFDKDNQNIQDCLERLRCERTFCDQDLPSTGQAD
jgi:hypothetical protein